MASCLVGNYLPLDVLLNVLHKKTRSDTIGVLREAFEHPAALDSTKKVFPKDRLLQDVVLELCTNVISAGVEMGLSAEGISAFVGMSLETHHKSMSLRYALHEAQGYFLERLHEHSIHRPPFCLAVFVPKEVESIQCFMTHTYWRYYRMYFYLFTQPVDLNLTITHVAPRNEVPKSICPLSQALTLSDYEAKQLALAQEKLRQRELEDELEAKKREQEEEQRLKEEAEKEELEMPSLLKAQIESIKELLETRTLDKNIDIEQRLKTLEEKVSEFTKHISSQKKRK